MSDALEGARDKLARGDSHRAITRREIRRFFNSHPDPTFKVEPEGDPSLLGVGDIYRAWMVVDRGVPDLPASFSARFGDILHNYRSVLDHIAWQLVRHGSSWPLKNDRAKNRVQFPTYDTAVEFDKNVAGRLPGVSPTVIDYIRQRYEFDARGNPTNDALLWLARMSNEDKHRSLHTSVGVFRSVESNVEFTRCVPVRWGSPPGRPALKAGTKIAHITARITGPNPKMKMKVSPTVQVIVEGLTDMTEMIEGLRGEVRKILDAPEILAAVS
jgi:hypothetical protein